MKNGDFPSLDELLSPLSANKKAKAKAKRGVTREMWIDAALRVKADRADKWRELEAKIEANKSQEKAIEVLPIDEQIAARKALIAKKEAIIAELEAEVARRREAFILYQVPESDAKDEHLREAWITLAESVGEEASEKEADRLKYAVYAVMDQRLASVSDQIDGVKPKIDRAKILYELAAFFIRLYPKRQKLPKPSKFAHFRLADEIAAEEIERALKRIHGLKTSKDEIDKLKRLCEGEQGELKIAPLFMDALTCDEANERADIALNVLFAAKCFYRLRAKKTRRFYESFSQAKAKTKAAYAKAFNETRSRLAEILAPYSKRPKDLAVDLLVSCGATNPKR